MVDKNKYANMQKQWYENGPSPEDLVGNYQWHERFPYEQYLLHKNGDLTAPLVDEVKDKVALDFGCGMGRMILRLQKFFKRVDGVDISSKMLKAAVNTNGVTGSNLYLSDGLNIGEAENNRYDFVYSTIALQHIASRAIRNGILSKLIGTLNPAGGVLSIQMAYTEGGVVPVPGFFGVPYTADYYEAKGTNSACDVMLCDNGVTHLVKDLGDMGLIDINVTKYRVDDKYEGKSGWPFHSPYWPSHWIFFNGRRSR